MNRMESKYLFTQNTGYSCDLSSFQDYLFSYSKVTGLLVAEQEAAI